MEYRNAKRTAAGLIDCEINHPEHGWIPFTADPADTGATFDVAALVERIETDGNVAAYTPPAITSNEVNVERDRRLVSGFSFPRPDGDVWQFQSDDVSVKRITGSATLAGFAIAGGTQPGDLFWFDPVTPFAWILEDNRVVPVDAPTMLEIGKAAASWEGRHVFAAKALKEMDPIPADFTDDKYWP